MTVRAGQSVPIATDAIWAAKGDLAVASGSRAALALAPGPDGDVLTADSTQTAGLKWAAAGAATVLDETLWSTDPRVAVPTDGTSDCASAINAGIAMGVAATGGRFALVPTMMYMIKSPIEVLGRVKFGGIEARNTIIKQDPAFAGTHMIRNWTTADYNTGSGENPLGRAVPAARRSSSVVPYPQISHLHLTAVNADTSHIGWIGQQETSYIDDLILDTSGFSATNQGIWGIDMQDQSSSGFNGGRIQNIVCYGNGWERTISLDGSVDGGSDSYIDNIFPSPATCYHSVIYVNRVVDVEVSRLHMEQQTDAGAEALIYLSSAYGFTLRGGGMTVKQAQAAPFLRQVHSGPGAFETPPLIDGYYFYDSMSSGSWDTAWPAGFIIDLFNTIPNPPNISSGATAHAAQMIHRYDGTQMTWTDNAKNRFQTYFKAPDIKGITDVQLNATHLDCAGTAVVTGQGYTTPDASGLDITDLDLRVLIEPATWAQAATATLISKHAAGNWSFQFFLDTAGKLGLEYTTDGSTTHTLHSSVAVSGSGLTWVRVAANTSATTFYTSSDPTDSAGTQLGTATTALTGSIYNSTRALAVAQDSTGGGRFEGNFYKAEIRNYAATLVADLDLTDVAPGASVTDGEGNVWTAGVISTIVVDALLDLRKITPGADGQVLTMVSGVPTWV